MYNTNLTNTMLHAQHKPHAAPLLILPGSTALHTSIRILMRTNTAHHQSPQAAP